MNKTSRKPKAIRISEPLASISVILHLVACNSASGPPPARHVVATPPGAPAPSPAPSPSDTLSPVWDEHGKYGFINAYGKVIVAPKFEAVRGFQEGVAPFRQDNRWGFIDRTGQIVLPAQWKNVRAFSEGLAAVVVDVRPAESGRGVMSTKVGYIDHSGQYVVAPAWRLDADHFRSGLAIVRREPAPGEKLKDVHYHYIGRDGHPAFPSLEFDLVSPFSEGLAYVELRGAEKHGFINTTGAVLAVPDEFFVDPVESDFLDGRVCGFGLDFERLFLDKTGRRVFSFPPEKGANAFTDEGWSCGHFSEGLAAIKLNGKYGYVNISGTSVIQPRYDFADDFHDGVAFVVNDEEGYRYIDTGGHAVLSVESREMFGARCDRPSVDHGGYYGGLIFLQVHPIDGGCDIEFDSPNPDNVYGYRNKSGKYVWVSPHAERHLKSEFWKDDYVGPPRGN